MSVVTLVGDSTTTTALAMYAGWIRDQAVLVVEADRTGGSLAAWLDTPVPPSLATMVATGAVSASTIESMVHRSISGVRFIPAPVRSRAASSAIAEAEHAMFALLPSLDGVVVADGGCFHAADRLPTIVSIADTIVVCHRQMSASAAAAAVRLDRLIESVGALAAETTSIVLAIIGNDPFDPADIVAFVDAEVPGAVNGWCELAHDPLAAAVLAGHQGVSAKRLRRLPLMRTAAALARVVRAELPATGIAGDPTMAASREEMLG